MRAAIYARYSTDLQNDRSVEDQIALCEEYAAREKLDVVARYFDRARCGGTLHGRDGLASLMEAAARGEYQAVIVEALDRLARDMEGLAATHKRLSFAGVTIRAVHEGEVNTVLVGLRGLVGQLYREDNADKVRRGMRGRAANGLMPSGLAYGYRPVPGEPGRRVIHEDEAAVIRRIFTEYLDGASPVKIARGLNADGIPAPRGGKWLASTIKGGTTRPYGILRKSVYCGVVTWGHARNVRHPETGRIVQRLAPDDVARAEMPGLAIISEKTWQAAQEALAERRRDPFTAARAHAYALSGLLRCAACGSSIISGGHDRKGRRRLHCSSYINGTACPAPRTYFADGIQAAIVNLVEDDLIAQLAEYARTYHEERRRLAAEADGERRRLETAIARTGAELERVIDCIARGHGSQAVLGPRSTALHADIEDMRARLAALPSTADNIVRLHPTAIERFRAQLAAIRTGETDADALRQLIAHVNVHAGPRRSGRATLEIAWRLAALTDGALPPVLVEMKPPGRIPAFFCTASSVRCPDAGPLP